MHHLDGPARLASPTLLAAQSPISQAPNLHTKCPQRFRPVRRRRPRPVPIRSGLRLGLGLQLALGLGLLLVPSRSQAAPAAPSDPQGSHAPPSQATQAPVVAPGPATKALQKIRQARAMAPSDPSPTATCPACFELDLGDPSGDPPKGHRLLEHARGLLTRITKRFADYRCPTGSKPSRAHKPKQILCQFPRHAKVAAWRLLVDYENLRPDGGSVIVTELHADSSQLEMLMFLEGGWLNLIGVTRKASPKGKEHYFPTRSAAEHLQGVVRNCIQGDAGYYCDLVSKEHTEEQVELMEYNVHEGEWVELTRRDQWVYLDEYGSWYQEQLVTHFFRRPHPPKSQAP